MTRDEMVTAAKALGYTHVRTAGAAPVPLDEWAPYGWPTVQPDFIFNETNERILDQLSPNDSRPFIPCGSWPLIRA